MKNKRLEIIILAVTLVFTAFTAGFFIGRSTVDGSFTVETQHNVQSENVSQNESNDTFTSDETIGLININTADLDTLADLPYIGDVIGQRIIDYRVENGDFMSIEDIKNVSGIGDAIFDEISSLITISD